MTVFYLFYCWENTVVWSCLFFLFGSVAMWVSGLLAHTELNYGIYFLYLSSFWRDLNHFSQTLQFFLQIWWHSHQPWLFLHITAIKSWFLFQAAGTRSPATQSLSNNPNPFHFVWLGLLFCPKSKQQQVMHPSHWCCWHEGCWQKLPFIGLVKETRKEVEV